MAKKLLKRFTALILVGIMFMTVSIHAQASDRFMPEHRTTEGGDSGTVEFNSYEDPVLNSIIQECGWTEEQVAELDRLIEEELSKPQVRSVTTVAAVTGIVVGAVGLMGATYQAGRYAARQCEVRLGLTKSQYRANRWTYRAALSGFVFTGGTTGAIVALGFDDYYMGV